jgi:hypothetical protein
MLRLAELTVSDRDGNEQNLYRVVGSAEQALKWANLTVRVLRWNGGVATNPSVCTLPADYYD